MIYNLGEWAKAPTKFPTGGRTVRLGGYRLQPINTLEVHGTNRNKLVLLVVPPHVDPDLAHDIMMAAAAPNNISSVDDLLMVSAQDREGRTRTGAWRG